MRVEHTAQFTEMQLHLFGYTNTNDPQDQEAIVILRTNGQAFTSKPGDLQAREPVEDERHGTMAIANALRLCTHGYYPFNAEIFDGLGDYLKNSKDATYE